MLDVSLACSHSASVCVVRKRICVVVCMCVGQCLCSCKVRNARMWFVLAYVECVSLRVYNSV